ncbi:MAG TPA: hypothetical protein PLH94_00720 [Fimbriimonadaceae bacterium]|nr:hypothetical protein [Fimbriimonadaceae bacterium]
MLSYQWRVSITPGDGVPHPYEVKLIGPGGEAHWTRPGPTSAHDWMPIEIPLKQSEWTLTSGTWAGLLANITTLGIRVRQFTNTDATQINGLDSVVLSIPTPISGSVHLQDMIPDPSGKVAEVIVRQNGQDVLVKHVVLGAGGSYSISANLEAGPAVVAVKASHWLRSTVAITVVSPGAAVPDADVSLVNGDTDGNNLVDSDDFDILVANFGSSGPTADLNEDGVVNSDDFDILVASFGTIGSP